ncbi:MAG TPA: chorismate lyase [Cyclobacteriaceae bacterium]|jgi:chorismate-pyruvate lyase/SAM-dependent methyltransferase|nr:chorismate lyase [Cyclobacteriaceae bacterium]
METQTAISTRNKKGFTYELTSFGKAFINFASKATKPVMDIGAAYGVATIPALETGARVIAVDIEEEHLIAIADSLDTPLRNRLITLKERFPDFDLAPESIGAVYMSQVLPFLSGEEIEQGAKSIYNWLAPGGEVFVVSFTPYISHVSSYIPLYEERQRAGVKWAGYIDDLSRFSNDPNIYRHLPNKIHHIGQEDLQRAFVDAGFVIREIRYFGEEEGALPEGIRMDGRERVGMIAYKPTSSDDRHGVSYWKTITSSVQQSEQVPQLVRGWLYKPHVLSQALKKVCHEFCVEVTSQSMKPLYSDEVAALKCYETPFGYIRETYLGEKGNPLVYARVTMPFSTYQARREELDNLGDRPIGETILYKDATLSRSEFEVKRITENDELLFDAMVHENFYKAVVQRKARLPELWARRSMFKLSGNPLLITEVFLANLPDYVD